jgi:UDP-glucuronate decarboxylase
LEIARKHKAALLFTSTSEVYGDPEQHPQTESYRGHVNTLGVRACYDEGKRVAETVCMDHQRLYGTKLRIVRIFNTYGPNMDPEDGRVVTNFIQQALQNKDLTVYGSGTQTRSFCYVDDLVHGLLVVMNQEQDCVGPVNLGYPQEHTMIELALIIKQITNSKSKITFKPLPPDDPVRRKPDISLAKALGWTPTVSLQQGLHSLMIQMKSLLKSLH